MANGTNGGMPAAVQRDRWVIFVQLGLGAGLVVFGALLLLIFNDVGIFNANATNGLTQIGGNVAVAVIGIGAALLPAGAAASASARILQGLPAAPPTAVPTITGVSSKPADPGPGTTITISANTNGFPGTWGVRYGTGKDNYQSSLASATPLTATSDAQTVSLDVPGLTAGQGHHFRAYVLTDNAQTALSDDQEVT